LNPALKILVSPLDWGLGHASRMIPVIRGLKRQGHRIILGGSGRSLELLRKTFPDCEWVILPSRPVKQGAGRFSFIGLIGQIPHIWLDALRENWLLRKLIEKYRIDAVISDNRYGLYNREVFSIFVTHQVSPKLPVGTGWLEYLLYRIIRNRIMKFNRCWIPDFEDADKSLAGDLCHRFPLPPNAVYIGLLSRFTESIPDVNTLIPGDYPGIVAVMSGPEPQVSSFEKILCRRIAETGKNAFFVRGLRGISRSFPCQQAFHIRFEPHLEDTAFRNMLMNAETIICRAGYTGISDLVALGLPAILVPSPGQSEQEYLAKRFLKGDRFTVLFQHQLKKADFLKDQHIQKAKLVSEKVNLYFLQDLERKYSDYYQKTKQKS
jgi:UDP:flavonoid glycosyltransferase YjiC (YdhE family)